MPFDWFHDPQVPPAEKLHPKEPPRARHPQRRSNWEGLAAREAAPVATSSEETQDTTLVVRADGPALQSLVEYLHANIMPQINPKSREALRWRINAVGGAPHKRPPTSHALAVIREADKERESGSSWKQTAARLNKKEGLNPIRGGLWTAHSLRKYCARNRR